MGTGVAGSSRRRGLDACLASGGSITGTVPSVRLNYQRFPCSGDHASCLLVRADHFGISEHDLASAIRATGIGSLKGKDSQR